MRQRREGRVGILGLVRDAEASGHGRKGQADADDVERPLHRPDGQDAEGHRAEDDIGQERHAEPHRRRTITLVVRAVLAHRGTLRDPFRRFRVAAPARQRHERDERRRAARERAEHRADQRDQRLAAALQGGDDEHQRPGMPDGRPPAVHPHDGDAAEQAGNDEEQRRLEGGADRVSQIDDRQGREPADAERAEELRPHVRDGRDGYGVDRAHAEGDQEGRDDRDWRPESGDALQERREHPSERDDDEQLVAAEAGDALAQGVVAARLVRDLVEEQRRPDHVQDEDRVPDTLRAGDGDGFPRRRKSEQRHRRGREHSHGPGLRRLPPQHDQQDQQHDDRQQRERPVDEIDRDLGVLHGSGRGRDVPTASGEVIRLCECALCKHPDLCCTGDVGWSVDARRTARSIGGMLGPFVAYREGEMPDPAATRADAVHQTPARSATRTGLDDWLDQALADTFPASDPVATPPRLATAAKRDGQSQPNPASGRTAQAPGHQDR